MIFLAHVAKYTRGSIKGLAIHWERKTDKHSNKEIDNERTYLNYDLCEKEGDTLSRLEEILNDVYCLNRKDVNVCADWVVTLPVELKDKSIEEQRLFFESTYDFLCDRYGSRSVLSAYVHNDETTPHMHFAFVPIAWDPKNKRDRVSAKLVVSRNDLRSFHNDLDNYLKLNIPHIYEKGILNDKTIGVDTVEDLKKQSIKIQEMKDEMVKDFEVFKEPAKVLEKITQRVEVKKSGIFTKDEFVKISTDDFEKLKILSLSGMKTKKKLSEVAESGKERLIKKDSDINNLRELLVIEEQRNNYLRLKNEQLEKENDELVVENVDLKNNIVLYAENHADQKYKEMQRDVKKAIEDSEYYYERASELADESIELDNIIDSKNQKINELSGQLEVLQEEIKDVVQERDLWKNKFEYLWESTKEYLREYIPNEMSEMIGTIKQWFKSDTGDHIEPEREKQHKRSISDDLSL